MTTRAGDPRQTHRWRQLRVGLIAAATHCAICGQPLDKQAPPRSRRRPSVDHIVSIRLRPDLAFVRANLRVVHHGCNSSRGATEGNLARRKPQPRWSW